MVPRAARWAGRGLGAGAALGVGAGATLGAGVGAGAGAGAAVAAGVAAASGAGDVTSASSVAAQPASVRPNSSIAKRFKSVVLSVPRFRPKASPRIFAPANERHGGTGFVKRNLVASCAGRREDAAMPIQSGEFDKNWRRLGRFTPRYG